FFFQAEDGIRDRNVTGVQTGALPILNDIDWDKSNVWKVMDGDKQVAEICKEGFGRIPGQNGVTYQVVAVYPVGEDNKVDLANGRSEERRVGKECEARMA